MLHMGQTRKLLPVLRWHALGIVMAAGQSGQRVLSPVVVAIKTERS